MTLLQKLHLNLLPITARVNVEGLSILFSLELLLNVWYLGQGHAVDHVVEGDPVPGRSRALVAVVEVVNVAVVENEAEAVNDHVIENEAVVGTFMSAWRPFWNY